MEIRLPSFAKLNLNLRVLGKRPDGYHELSTIFQTVELHDSLSFRFTPGDPGIDLKISGTNLPLGEENLIQKAFDAFHRASPFRLKAEVSVDKRIPLESGLGGGSSNAAATLVALSRALDWPLSLQQLSNIASSIGADVPFFLAGGTAHGAGRGDAITALEDWPPADVLLIRPSVTCSTAAIYRYYDDWNLLTASENSIKIHLRPESLREVISHIENDLERVVFALYPELDSIKKRLHVSGAVAAGLTGSGSVIFGLFENQQAMDRAAREWPDAIKTKFLSRSVYQTKLEIGR